MELQLVQIQNDKQEMKWIRRLFVSAFPREERPPFFMMRRGVKRGSQWWKITADGQNAGFFYVISDTETAYVFYFAILPEYRGQHIGTQALQMLITKYEGRILYLAIEPIEQEAPNLQERINRKNFYLRCGLLETGLSIREGGVTYEVLGTSERISSEGYLALMKNWGGWYLRIIPMELFRTR